MVSYELKSKTVIKNCSCVNTITFPIHLDLLGKSIINLCCQKVSLSFKCSCVSDCSKIKKF